MINDRYNRTKSDPDSSGKRKPLKDTNDNKRIDKVEDKPDKNSKWL